MTFQEEEKSKLVSGSFRGSNWELRWQGRMVGGDEYWTLLVEWAGPRARGLEMLYRHSFTSVEEGLAIVKNRLVLPERSTDRFDKRDSTSGDEILPPNGWVRKSYDDRMPGVRSLFTGAVLQDSGAGW